MSATAGARRGWVAAGLAVVAVFVALGLISEAFSPAPAGPAGSALATSPAGAAAWAQLLAANGHPVTALRDPLSSARLPADATLVVLEAGALSSGETVTVRRFLGAGGTLVIGGGDPERTLTGLISAPPVWAARGPTRARPRGAGPEVSGVALVQTSGSGAWMGDPRASALLGGAGGTLLERRRIGAGAVELLADASPVENALLASADNAQLALNLAGPGRRSVLFAEALHGFTTATGLAAIPARWWILGVGLALAGVAWAIGRGRRLGPPERPAPAPPPPRTAYVDALASALVRARDPQTLAGLARNLPPPVSQTTRL